MAACRGLDQTTSLALLPPERSDGTNQPRGKCAAFFADIMRPPSRAPRRPAPRATPPRVPQLPQRGPIERSVRSRDLPAAPPPAPPELAEPSLDPVAGDGTGDCLLRHRQAEPRFPVVFLAREPVER